MCAVCEYNKALTKKRNSRWLFSDVTNAMTEEMLNLLVMMRDIQRLLKGDDDE